MEQTNNNFPRFEKGQVLTSEALNNYFGYLDEQQRLTRAKLLGVGIIDGLETKLSGNKLTITKGTAVTADGYLIELKEDTTYNLIYEYDKKNMLAKQSPLSDAVDKDFETVLNNVKYVFYKDESDATRHNLSSTASNSMPKNWETDYVLALMVDFDSQDTITKCNELSCDIVQSNYQIEIRPVLINYSCIGKDYYINLNTPDVEESVKTTAKIVLNPKKPLSFYIDTYRQLQESIVSEINFQIFSILNAYKKFLFNTNVTGEIENATALLCLMEDIINKQKKSKSTRFSGYYLDFLIQLRTAIREFINTFLEFTWKYKKIPNDAKAFPRIVIIGFGDLRRQTRFWQGNSYMDDITILRKHFYRIVSMSESFYKNINNEDYVKSISNKELSGCYIKKGSKLGERDIPGFYVTKQQDGLCDNWQAHSHTESLLSYKNWLDKYEQIPILSDFSDYYLVFDNYYGRSLNEFNIAYNNSKVPGYSYKVHYIHIDSESGPDYFSINEDGYGLEKGHYKDMMDYVKDRSSKLNEEGSIFEKVINSIVNRQPINWKTNDLIELFSNIDYWLENPPVPNMEDMVYWNKDSADYLKRTKSFLSQFCDITDAMLMIGGCRAGGDLYVFYSGDKDKNGYGDNNFIALMVGTC